MPDPTNGAKEQELRATRILKRFKQLKQARMNWESIWQEVLKYTMPHKAFVTRKRDVQGSRVDKDLLDSTAGRANQVLAAGFQGNLTNPSSRWFKLRLQEPTLNEDQLVRIWLSDAEDKIFDALNASNFNQQMHECYLDLGSTGTTILSEFEDPKDLIRFKCYFIEEIVIDEDHNERVDSFFRKYRMTARQAYGQWGDAAGKKVMEAIEKEEFDKEIEFLQAIFPRDIFDPNSQLSKNLPVASVHLEVGEKHLIAEGGFHEQPMWATRFLKVAGDKYGYSPGVIMLPDIKMLNAITKTVIKGAQKIVDPPLVLPHDGFLLPLKTIPGGLNYKLSGPNNEKIEPLATGGNIPVGREMQNDLRQSISDGYFNDLFLTLRDRRNMTATEVQERIAEKMVMLGPTLGRLQSELLDPIVGRTFSILLRKGVIMPPPPALADKELTIEYVSPLALAQKREKLNAMQLLLQLAQGIAQVDPGVVDKINSDQVIDEAAEILGVSPEVVRDDDTVLQIREERAKEQAAQQMLDQAGQMAQTVKTATEADQPQGE